MGGGGQMPEIRGLKPDDAPVEHPGREPGSTGQGGQENTEVGERLRLGDGNQMSEVCRTRG